MANFYNSGPSNSDDHGSNSAQDNQLDGGKTGHEEEHRPNQSNQDNQRHRRSSHPTLGHPQHHTPLHELDLAELERDTHLEFLRRDMSFIQLLQNASLDDPGGLSGDALLRLCNPLQSLPEITNPVIELALRMFLALKHSSQQAYTMIRDAVEKCFPGSNVPSLYQIKKTLTDVTGVKPVLNDMCINSCIAYTGPYQDLEQCPDPCAVFNTILIGPQLQALYRHPETVAKLRYREDHTQQILQELR
ncbi:hypothetical protein V8E55_012024 [Tylopilus felleus]